MENKKQGFLGAYKCLVLFAVMMVAAVAVTMVKPKAQVYTASARGFGGEVKVQVSVLGGEISSVVILDKSSETPEIGGAAAEKLASAMTEQKTVEVDSVAGASFTSKAVKDAVSDCLVQAGLMEAPEETTEAPAAEGTDYTATAKGFAGDVTVTITVDGSGTIVGCKIDAPAETPALGGVAAEKLSKSIVEKQGEVDVVASATYTSKAILAALEECMTAAGK